VRFDAGVVVAAAREVLPPRKPVGARWPMGWLPTAAAMLLLAVVGWFAWHARHAPVVPAKAPAARAATNLAANAVAGPAKTRAIPRLDADALASAADAAGASPAPAWEALLRAWKLPASAVTVDPADAACTATVADVHCVQGRARLDTLQALDRPLLLRLRGQSGEAWALLLGLDARDARIAVAGKTFDIDRLTLQSAWTGDYAGLWRGTPPALPADIAAFQGARGLRVDGVAGPETVMALAGDAPGPRLLRALDRSQGGH
jgi:general secretion pathway protein A